jgi:DNA replication protein DnaC
MTQETLEKMKKMRMHGMFHAYQTSLESDKINGYTTDQLISFLIESEWDDRHNRNIERRMKNARFRYQSTIEGLDYRAERNLDRNQMMRFAECMFIKKKENIFITGSTGIGKSYIASALGHQACIEGYKVMYANATKLFAKLKMAKADGTYMREINRIEKQNLLIIDDFGLQPLDHQNRSALMEIIEDRHGRASTIITSQIPVNKWYDIIGEKTMADAILDRIVHDAHRIDLKGESLRKSRSIRNINRNMN